MPKQTEPHKTVVDNRVCDLLLYPLSFRDEEGEAKKLWLEMNKQERCSERKHERTFRLLLHYICYIQQ